MISRIHGVPFRTFSQELFGPLESIVFAREDRSIRDFVYESRHPHIAELVFERVLVDPQARYAEYARILDNLDLAYAADYEAFRRMLSARELRQLFADSGLCRSLYDQAMLRYRDHASLMQQYAVYEMNASDGRLDVATDLLRRARALEPKNPSLRHSFAELLLKRASRAAHYAEREKLRDEAKSVLRAEFTGGPAASYTYHSFIKILLDEFEEFISQSSEGELQKKIHEIEQLIADALQRAPGDEYILDSESRLARLLKNSPRASDALRRAFLANKGSPYVALRFAKLLAGDGDTDGAISVLKECLEIRPAEKEVHFALAQLFADKDGDSSATAIYHLRQSFTKGDTRYEAQFWCARALYIAGDIVPASELFRDLAEASVSSVDRHRSRGPVVVQGTPVRYSGVVRRLEETYGYVQRDRTGDHIYVGAAHEPSLLWRSLRTGARVTFEISFNYRGPVANRLALETAPKELSRALPSTSGRGKAPGDADRPVDLGIVIAMREEFREFAGMIAAEPQRDLESGAHYYSFQYPDSEDGYRCIATMTGSMGQERTVLSTERLISKWRPKVMAVVGIAGALHSDVKLGDVVVASQVDLYAETAKAAGKPGEPFQLEAGGTGHATTHRLMEVVKNLEFSQAKTYQDWREQCRQNYLKVLAPGRVGDQLILQGLMEERPALCDVHLASGPFVAASSDFVQWLRSKNRQYKAVDMESGGFMLAAQAREQPPSTIVLRGISDYSDDRKAVLEERSRSGVRRYAMMNAIEFLLALLGADLVDRVERSVSSMPPAL